MLVAAAQFFGREVVFEERAARSLEMQRRVKTPKAPWAYHVWTALERQLPLLHELYAVLESPLDTSKSPFPRFERHQLNASRYDAKTFHWTEALEVIFGSPSSQNLTTAGQAIQENGLVRASDIVVSLLELKGRTTRGRADRWVSHHNGVLRQLLRAARTGFGTRRIATLEQLSKIAKATWLELCYFDLSLGYQQLIIWHDGKRYHVEPFGVFGGFRFEDQPQVNGKLWISRGNVLQPVEELFEDELREFEFLINSDVKESTFQEFFVRNPHFLLALGPYRRIHPQLILHHDEEGGLIPDFFLERIDSDLCDICDLKRPSTELVRHKKHRVRFSSVITQGLAQLREYRDWFDDQANREIFRSRYGLLAYRPRVVLIIGRSMSYYDDVERIKLEADLASWVHVTTYDDVLERVKHWRSLITSRSG